MARHGALAVLALLATASLATTAVALGSGGLHGAIHSALAQDQKDRLQQLEASSTRRLLAAETTVPITDSHSVTLPAQADLAGVLGGLATIASGSTTGMFPSSLFPELNGSRFGFAPNENSFCLFHVPKNGGRTPAIPAQAYVAPGAYGYSSSSGKYGGGYGGPIPGSYYAYGVHYEVADLTGPTPTPTYPYGLPGPLADLVQFLGAELDCLLAPLLPNTAPNFAVFIEVMLEDAFALEGEFIKLIQSGYLTGAAPPNTEEVIYLRNPVDPWGPPLKYSFMLDSLAGSYGIDNSIIPPLAAPAEGPVSEYTPTSYSGGSGVSDAFAAGAAAGASLSGYGYDGYLDQCQVILGTVPGSDGSFDKVNDFSESINDGMWSAPLSTLLNDTGDVAYVVPAARSGDYAQLTQANRGSAGYCYDIATLLPQYNPLATPIPTYIDPASSSVSATSLSTLLVFGEAFGLNQPSLKTALGIDQDVDLLTLNALNATENDPEGEGAWVYKQTIEVQNTVTMVTSLLCNDSSTYASFAVLVNQAISRAALAATVSDANQGFNYSGPALDLTNAQELQNIIYGARAWVATTSDQSLPQSLATVDARTIYAAAYATGNVNVAATQAGNATDIEKTAYYTQGTIVPMLEDVLDGTTSVDQFMTETSLEAVQDGLASTQLPGTLDLSSTLGAPTAQVGSTATQAASTSSSKGSRLSGGDIAGIVIGCVVGVALLAAAAAVALRARSQRRSSTSV